MLHAVLPFAVSICIMAYNCYIIQQIQDFLVLQKTNKAQKKKKQK
jgi:hypothetical protein